MSSHCVQPDEYVSQHNGYMSHTAGSTPLLGGKVMDDTRYLQSVLR
ncbi:MAG TPA: hypothetical protein VF914_07125 [Chloroflexia bacterium]|jgi:hypothetical protein